MSDKMEEIKDEVWRQYEAVRRKGQTNMLDQTMVQRIANENEFYELVNFIEDGRYAELLENYNKEKIEQLDILECKEVTATYEVR